MTLSTSSVSTVPDQSPVWHTLSVSDALREQSVAASTELNQVQAESD